jgi:hypothetical protein
MMRGGMPIHDAVTTLATMERLRDDFRRYRDLFGDPDQEDAAEAVRAELSESVAEIRGDLTELGVPQQVDFMGNVLDVLHTALTPLNGMNEAIPGQMLDPAVQLMETAVGAARRLVRQREQAALAAQQQRQREAQEAEQREIAAATERASVMIGMPPEEPRWGRRIALLGLTVVAAICIFAWGRYPDQIWNFGVAVVNDHPSALAVVAGAFALVVAMYAGNRASNGRFGENPVRNSVLLVLAFIATVAAIVLGKM